MTRIFLSLAAVDTLFLVLAHVLGWWSKLSDGVHQADTRLYLNHFLIGLTAAVLTLLVHCLIFIYFLGTGRWVKEVKYAYDLPDEPLPKRTRELKRRSFPPALFAMLSVIATGAAGAAVQVQATRWEVHFALATLALFINLWAFVVEYRCLSENAEVLVQVLEEVDAIRAARGLPSNAEALQQEQA